MELGLRRPTAEEWEGWLPAIIAGYADEIVASGSMPAEAALEKARGDTRTQLPDGLDTQGQFIFRLVADDQPVGWLWLAARSQANADMAWVNLVEVDEAFRGRGYGRQAMLLAEAEAQSRGIAEIGLNVHGSNTAARSLYESLGYQVMTQQMRKAL